MTNGEPEFMYRALLRNKGLIGKCVWYEKFVILLFIKTILGVCFQVLKI